MLSALEGQRQNYELNFRESSTSIKNTLFKNIISLFIACGLILLQSKLFWIVISCKIVNSLLKFNFISKISVIQYKFLIFLNLLRGLDMTCSWSDLARVHGLCIPVVIK